MKKFTLFLFASLFSALSFAALNPYAYGLSSKLSDDEKTVTITYKLNAPATEVSVVVLDGETVLRTQPSTGITQGEHNVDILTDGFPKGKTLSWKVVVNGNSVASPTLHDESIRFYLPYGMDIDVDSESDYLGQWYVIEANAGAQNKTGYEAYQSYKVGRGLYAFDAQLKPIKNNSGNSGFTGGMNVGALTTDKNINGDMLNFYRVATSGGRVFIGRFRDGASYHPIVEADPADLNATFTSVFTTGCAASLDARGSGDDLKLVMMTKDKVIYEYDLGNAKSIAAASRTINIGDLSILRDDATITYDNNGGIWFNQNRGTATEASPTIAHLTASGVDYNNVKAGLTHNNTNNSGIAVSPDGKQLAVVGAESKNITIYNINNAGGNITLTKAYSFAVSAGDNHTALAWDYAGNLFAANRSKERIRIFAMPYSGTVSTPCPSKHAFSLKADPQLNPFAYNLTSELSADEKDLTINYSLNAKATSVEWVLMNGNNVVKTVDLASLGLEKGNYTTTISTTDFPQYKQLTWKIEVKGVAVSEPTHVKAVSFYRPFGVDIDNNPENPHFGRILCGETYTTSNTNYESCGVGAGIYEYSPAFELKPNDTKPGYNGGKTFTEHSPYRVRISEDGRIFVTAHDQAGEFLWEVNPDNLNEWTSVFQGATHNTSKLLDASGKFIAGTNAGFDVRGTGENLQLLMLSCNNLGTSSATFQCHEYNLGNATEWSTVPTRSISDIQLHSSMISRYSQVLYDKEGGFWEIYYINTSLLGGIAHFAKQADGSYVKDYVKNKIMLRAGGCAFNHDFSKLILCGDVDVTTNSPGSAVIYSVSKDADGKPVLTKETTINTAVVGGNLNDFAWDYADNIYVVGNNGELLQVYALPHSSDDVVATPAASKYTFSIGKYSMIVNTNDENKGTVTGTGEYKVGETATLTATAKEGYKLLYWSDRSTENPRTITMNKNEALSAYFIKKNDVEPTFSITKVWENTNVPASTGNGFQAVGWNQKIYMQDAGNQKIMTFTNETGNATEYAVSGSGQQIAVDEVGNLIVFNAYFATATPGSVLIYQKGSTTGKVVNFTLPNPARCDFFSASGNIFSAEGGYVYFYCNGKQVINRLKITNGAATAADVMTDIVGGSIYETTMNQNHVMVDIFGNLVTHARANALNTINVYTNEVAVFTNLLSGIKTTTLGGCSFELGGKELWAYNVGTTNFNSEWNIYNITDTKFLSNEALYINNKTLTGSAANWLNVQVVDEKTAYIYQFCPKVGVAMWRVTRDHIVNATAENGTVDGAGTYKDNATATLTATPNKGYQFKNWTKNGAVVSTVNPYSFTVTEDVELVANFDGPFNELILNTNDEAKGTVSGAGFYTAGQTATLTATPAAGYKLLYWSDRSTENPRTITMNKDEAISAYFVKEYDMEPTIKIEKVWENTQVPGSADGYQAVGWDGKIYMQNKTAGKIKVYSNGTDAAVDYATSNTSGQQIAVDEAGNLIVFNATFYTITPNAIMIYPKGSTTGTAISFTLPYPERCDFISASGDIYSAEGGYVYFYCQNKNAVNRVKITNGALASVDAIGNTEKPATSVSHVMVDIFGNLAAHCRSTAVYAINSYTGETTAFTTTLSGVKLSTLGGCTFELGGKELWAYNVGTTNYNSEWNLYNMTDKVFMSNETLYAKDKDSKKNTGPANWLNVQVVDEKTVYIYQFCPEVAVAVWKVTCTTEKTVIIDENADNTAALAPYEGKTVTATVTRSFNNDSYKTITLPFSMDAAQISAVFGDATVLEFINVIEGPSEINLRFRPTSKIVAGTPYIIALPEGEYDAEDGFTIEDVVIDTELRPITFGKITMQPVLDGGGQLTKKTEYWLATDNYLYNVNDPAVDMPGLRAYFISSSPLPIRARVVYEENEETELPIIQQQPENNVRKIMKDGQIIIIRGEQQYNVQGQRID